MNTKELTTARIMALMSKPPTKAYTSKYRIRKSLYGPVGELGDNFVMYWKISMFRKLRVHGVIYKNGSEEIKIYTGNHNFSGWDVIDEKFFDSDVVYQEAFKKALQIIKDSADAEAQQILKNLS